MRKFLKHPFIIIGLSFLITVLFAIPLRKIRIESSIRQFFPQKHEAFQRLNRTEDTFGSMLAIGISIETPKSTILSPEYIDIVRRITARLEQVENTEDVTSITNIDYIVGENGSINVAPLLDKDDSEPVTDGDMETIVSRLTDWEEMYDLVVISKDGRGTQISLSVNPKATLAEQQKALDEIREIVNGQTEGTDLMVKFYGDPVISENSKNYMLSDLLVLIPLVILVVLISLYFSFRTYEGTLLPLITVLMSTIWSVGLMTILNFEFTMVSSVIPVALIGCGSAYGIHVLTHYYIAVDKKRQELKKTGGKFTIESHYDCIMEGLANVHLAVLLSAVTTIVGFMSLVTSPLRPLFSFAIFTGVGIAISLVLSVTLIPAFLVLKKLDNVGKRSKRMEKIAARLKKKLAKVESSDKRKGDNEKTTLANTLYNIYHFVCGTKPRMIVFSLVIVVFSLVGLFRIVIDTSMVNYFPETSQLRQDINYVNDNFAGTNSIYLLFNSPAAKPRAEANALYDEAQAIEDSFGGGEIDAASRAKIDELRERAAEKLSEADSLQNMTNPDVLKVLDDMEDWINRSFDNVGKVASYTDSIKRVNQTWNDPEAAAGVESWNGPNGSLDADTAGDEFGGFFDFGDSDSVAEPQTAATDDFADFFDFGGDEQASGADSAPTMEDPNDRYREMLSRQLSGAEVQQLLFSAYSKAGGNRASVEDFIKELQKQMNYNGTAFYEIPYEPGKYRVTSKEELASIASNYLQLLGDSMDRFTDDRTNFAPSAIRMQVQIKTNSTQVVGQMLNAIEEYARANLPEGYYMEATGEGEMEYVMTGLVVSSQITSLLLSLALVFVIISLSFRSPLAGIIGAIPLAFTIILNYMAMGLTGIKLDLFTSIIASVAIGVGIDYTIHFMTEYRELRMKSDDLEEVTRGTFRSSGLGIITNALAVGLGFIVLCLSRFIVLRYIGILVAIVMFTSSMLAMTILPAIFNNFDPAFMHPGKPKAWETEGDDEE